MTNLNSLSGHSYNALDEDIILKPLRLYNPAWGMEDDDVPLMRLSAIARSPISQTQSWHHSAAVLPAQLSQSELEKLKHFRVRVCCRVLEALLSP